MSTSIIPFFFHIFFLSYLVFGQVTHVHMKDVYFLTHKSLTTNTNGHSTHRVVRQNMWMHGMSVALFLLFFQ